LVEGTGTSLYGGPCLFFAELGTILEEAVEIWVKLYYPDENGVTDHDRYTQIEKQTGKYPGPDLIVPSDLFYIWEWFMDLSSSRGGGWGPSPITYGELIAWISLTGNMPSKWEVRMLKQMDAKYLEVINSIDKKRVKGK